MAKLSLKGIVSLSHQIIKDGKTNTHNIELFQDDFEDCVMLSVEEAQAIRSKLCDLLLFAKGKDRYQSNVKKDLSLLWGRIIQAEKNDD